MLKRCLSLLFLGTLSHSLFGQAIPSASSRVSLQIGVGGTDAFPDYGEHSIRGITAYGDLNFFNHFGLEADLHQVSLDDPEDFGQNSFVVGPRFIFPVTRFAPYLKAFVGRGLFTTPGSRSNQNSMVYGGGGGLDLAATRHFNIRVFDVEVQRWPGFFPQTLTPIVATVGIAYVIH